MSQKNDETLWIEHCVLAEKFGNEAVNLSKDSLELLIEDLTKLIKKTPYISSKEKYNQLIEEAEECLADYENLYNRNLYNHIKKAVTSERVWLQDFGKKIGKDYTIPLSLFSTVLFMPIAGHSDYKSITSKEVSKIKDTLTGSIKYAYVTKEETSQVADRLKNKLSRLEKDQATNVRTINTSAFRSTDFTVFKANKQKVMYSSILDNHTCLVCGMNHGKVFDVTNAPDLPVHENCRCTLLPLEIVNDDPMTYSEFIESLDDTDKREILGKTRYELYEKNIPISSFVNDGELVPAAELKLKYDE